MPSVPPPFDFRPLPLLGNPHVQTLLGAFLPGGGCPPPERRHVLPFADGDAVVLHENAPPGWRPGEPMALLVHGLTGSHRSTHIRRLAALLLARGVRVFRIDLRGAGESLPLARQTYHAGRSEDLRAALGLLHRDSPLSPLLLFALSLGGAQALKLAGEAADNPVPGLARVAVINPPIDLERCSALIALPRNRVYERQFVRDLVRLAERRQAAFPDLPPLRFPRRMTLRDFDELYTAPRNGFAGAADYYQRSSSFPLIPRITVPTLILTARDDPFIAVAPFEELQVPGHVEVTIVPQGGHVGFVGWDGAGGIRWAERRVVDWAVDGVRAQAR
ncbi:MAG: alpha/beta fold hydrolase [Gemmataceae bacterium]